MQDINNYQDISFILSQMRLVSKKEEKLSKKQKEKISRLSPEEQQRIEKKILHQQEEEKKNVLCMWAMLLEEKVKNSRLPKAVMEQILEFTTSIKSGNDTIVYNTETKVENLKETITESQKEERQQEVREQRNEEKAHIEEAIVENTISMVAPFVHAQYTQAKFEETAQSYFTSKILPDLVMAQDKPIVPVETKREYPKKKGSQYPKAQVELEQKHKNELMDLLIKEVQKGQTKEGKEIQTDEEILNSFNNMTPMKQKITLGIIAKNNPELIEQQKMEEQVAYEAQLKKNMERQKCRQEAKKLAEERRRKKEVEKMAQDRFKDKILPRLIMAGEKPIVPVEPKREYRKKQGAMYSQAELELQKKHEKELLGCLIKKIQKQQAKNGQPILTPEAIIASYDQMPEQDKKDTLRTLRSWNVELVRRQEEEQKALREAEQKKSQERLTQKLLKKSNKKTNVIEILEKGEKEKQDQKKSLNAHPNGLLTRLGKSNNVASSSTKSEHQQ